MPLYSIDGRLIDYLPHQGEFDSCRGRLSEEDFAAVVDELNRRVDTTAGSDKPVLTSSWIPGNDWTGTAYAPLYAACRQDRNRSGMFFGQILWQVMRNRTEDWSFVKADFEELGFQGTHYFRIRADHASHGA